jgi:protein-disulfide isomerase
MSARGRAARLLASNGVTAVLVASAVTVAALVARREFFAATPPAPAALVPDRAVAGWEGLLVDGRILGAPGAQVRIVEFSDFQCGFCERVRPELDRLRDLDPSRVAVVYRHNVREDVRPVAFAAAMASECAAEQGRFEAFHDAVFDAQRGLSNVALATLAERAGVEDLPAFAACVAEERFRGRVEADTRAALALGVRGTPSFVFDGVLYTGVSSPKRIETPLREALAVP